MKTNTKYVDREGNSIKVGDLIEFEQIGSNTQIISKVIDPETSERVKKSCGVHFQEKLNYIQHRCKIIQVSQ